MNLSRRLALLPLTLTLSLLTACKTSDAAKRSEDYSSATQTSTPQSKLSPESATDADSSLSRDERPVILCFGDSITAGYNLDPDDNYPAQLQAALDQQGYQYHVVNQGISGDTTKDALARIQQAIDVKPAIALVELGGNDGLRGIPIASTRANFDGILSRLKQSQAHVILLGITLPPQYGKEYIAQFNETYSLMAKKYGFTLFPFIYKDVYTVPGAIQGDGIHPTKLGSSLIVKNVLPLLKSELKK